MAYTKDSIKGSAELQQVCLDFHVFFPRESMKSRLGYRASFLQSTSLIIILSEVSQTNIIYMWNLKKMIQMNLSTNQK